MTVNITIAVIPNDLWSVKNVWTFQRNVLSASSLLLWRWRRCVPLNHSCLCTIQFGITTQQMWITCVWTH